MDFLKTIYDRDVFPNQQFPVINEWSTRRTVKVILLNEENKIALITNPIHKCFLLPGGGIDDGEDVDMAADRECKEEVGFSIVPSLSLGVIEEYRARDGKRYETHGVVANLKERIVEDLRTEDEKKNGVTADWYTSEQVEELFRNQTELLEQGKIDFYNTGFNIIRDAIFMDEFRKRANK